MTVASKEAELFVSNQTSFSVDVSLWGHQTYKQHVESSDHLVLTLLNGTYGWNVYGNGCPTDLDSGELIVPDIRSFVIRPADNECGAVVNHANSSAGGEPSPEVSSAASVPVASAPTPISGRSVLGDTVPKPTEGEVYFYSDRATIKLGEMVKIHWSVNNFPDTSVIYVNGEMVHLNQGTWELSPARDTVYTLRVEAGGQAIENFLSITVIGPTATPTATPVITATASLAAPLSPGNTPIGIEYLGNAKYACYNIQGSNGYQLAKQMNRLGPYSNDWNETWAVATTRFNISGGMCYQDGTTDFSSLRVTVNATITVPCWYPASGTHTAEVAKFDRLMRDIARHELRHVEIVWQYAHILEQRLKNSNTCNDTTWGRIFDQTRADTAAAQDAFHATDAGQPFRYP